MVFDESFIVQERRNSDITTQMVLTQAAISSALSKKGAAHFKKQIKRLNVEAKTRDLHPDEE